MNNPSLANLVTRLTEEMVENSPFALLAGQPMAPEMEAEMEKAMERLASPIHEHVVGWSFSYELPQATSNDLGGIILGNGLEWGTNGKVNVIFPDTYNFIVSAANKLIYETEDRLVAEENYLHAYKPLLVDDISSREGDTFLKLQWDKGDRINIGESYIYGYFPFVPGDGWGNPKLGDDDTGKRWNIYVSEIYGASEFPEVGAGKNRMSKWDAVYNNYEIHISYHTIDPDFNPHPQYLQQGSNIPAEFSKIDITGTGVDEGYINFKPDVHDRKMYGTGTSPDDGIRIDTLVGINTAPENNFQLTVGSGNIKAGGYYVGVTQKDTYWDAKVDRGGDTMTGLLIIDHNNLGNHLELRRLTASAFLKIESDGTNMGLYFNSDNVEHYNFDKDVRIASGKKITTGAQTWQSSLAWEQTVQNYDGHAASTEDPHAPAGYLKSGSNISVEFQNVTIAGTGGTGWINLKPDTHDRKIYGVGTSPNHGIQIDSLVAINRVPESGFQLVVGIDGSTYGNIKAGSYFIGSSNITDLFEGLIPNKPTDSSFLKYSSAGWAWDILTYDNYNHWKAQADTGTGGIDVRNILTSEKVFFKGQNNITTNINPITGGYEITIGQISTAVPAHGLTDHTNVNISSASEGQLLVYSAANQWENTTWAGSTNVITLGTITSGDVRNVDSFGYLTGKTSGDIFYWTTSLQRLAKGTANQFLRMNSGASAPEWVSGDYDNYNSWKVTYDIETPDDVLSGHTVKFVASTNINIVRSAPVGGVHTLTFSATGGGGATYLNDLLDVSAALPSHGDILVYDTSGESPLWVNSAGGAGGYWTKTGDDIYYTSGKVGIGESVPVATLHVKSSTWENTRIQRDGTGGTAVGFFNNTGKIAEISAEGTGGLWLRPTASAGGSLLNGILLKNDGNIGIGTTNPANALHVNDDSDSQYIRVSRGAATASYLLLGAISGRTRLYSRTPADAALPMDFQIGATTMMVINDVGLSINNGTTAAAYPLDVTGNALISGVLSIGTFSSAYAIYAVKSSHGIYSRTTSTSASIYAFRVGSGTTTDNFAVMGNGNVGIGTATPGSPLELRGASSSSIFRINSLSGTTGMLLQSNGTSLGHFWGGTSFIAIGRGSAANSIFFNIASDKQGVGRSDPQREWHVYHATANSVMSVERGAATTSALLFAAISGKTQIVSRQNNSSGTGVPLEILMGGTVVATIATTGNWDIDGNVSLGTTSAVAHLAFKRGSVNYITAPAGGNFAFIGNGMSIGTANAALRVLADDVHMGRGALAVGQTTITAGYSIETLNGIYANGQCNINRVRTSTWNVGADNSQDLYFQNINTAAVNNTYAAIRFRVSANNGTSNAQGHFALIQPTNGEHDSVFVWMLRTIGGAYNERMRLTSAGALTISSVLACAAATADGHALTRGQMVRAGSSTTGGVRYVGTSTTIGYFNGSATAPSSETYTLNFNGNFRATKIYANDVVIT